MVIKDFYCTHCNHVLYDFVVDNCDVSEFELECSLCKKTTKHLSLCNGGCGKRYRFADWDIEEIRKGIQYTGCGLEQDGVSEAKTEGKFSSDAIAERRKIADFNRNKGLGRNRLYF